MGETSIEWCDHSINPIRARAGDSTGHWCEKISPGCANCYASAIQKRFGTPPFGSARERGIVKVFLDEGKLQEVLRRRKPTKYFWCDMTDLFGEWVPFDWIDRCFAVMALTPQHTHQVLTKRPERMAEYMARSSIDRAISAGRWPLPNCWLGTSCEDQRRADERIPHLLDCPAAVRFVSCEPLLSALDLREWFGYADRQDHGEREADELPRASTRLAAPQREHPTGTDDQLQERQEGGRTTQVDRGGLRRELRGHLEDRATRTLGSSDLVIVGGESGPGARPCNINWIRSIIKQCKLADVPCFVKQLGANIVVENDQGDEVVVQTLNRKGSDPAEWPADLQIREFPLFAAAT